MQPKTDCRTPKTPPFIVDLGGKQVFRWSRTTRFLRAFVPYSIMVLLGLSFNKVSRDSKFNICQDSLFSVDTTLPSAEAGDDPFSAAEICDGSNGDSPSHSISSVRLNSVLASIPGLSEDYWRSKSTKERECLVASLRAALKVEGVDGDKNTVVVVGDGTSKEELIQNMVDRRRRFVEYMCDVRGVTGECNRRASINFATLLDRLKTLMQSNSFKPYEKALLVGRDFWSTHVATNVFHSMKNNVSDSTAKRFFLYSVSHMPMVYLTSFILIKQLERGMAVFSQVVEEIMYEVNRNPEVLLSLFRSEKIEKRRAATKLAFDRMVKLLERRAYLQYLRRENIPVDISRDESNAIARAVNKFLLAKQNMRVLEPDALGTHSIDGSNRHGRLLVHYYTKLKASASAVLSPQCLQDALDNFYNPKRTDRDVDDNDYDAKKNLGRVTNSFVPHQLRGVMFSAAEELAYADLSTKELEQFRAATADAAATPAFGLVYHPTKIVRQSSVCGATAAAASVTSNFGKRDYKLLREVGYLVENNKTRRGELEMVLPPLVSTVGCVEDDANTLRVPVHKLESMPTTASEVDDAFAQFIIPNLMTSLLSYSKAGIPSKPQKEVVDSLVQDTIKAHINRRIAVTKQRKQTRQQQQNPPSPTTAKKKKPMPPPTTPPTSPSLSRRLHFTASGDVVRNEEYAATCTAVGDASGRARAMAEDERVRRLIETTLTSPRVDEKYSPKDLARLRDKAYQVPDKTPLSPEFDRLVRQLVHLKSLVSRVVADLDIQTTSDEEKCREETIAIFVNLAIYRALDVANERIASSNKANLHEMTVVFPRGARVNVMNKSEQFLYLNERQYTTFLGNLETISYDRPCSADELLRVTVGFDATDAVPIYVGQMSQYGRYSATRAKLASADEEKRRSSLKAVADDIFDSFASSFKKVGRRNPPVGAADNLSDLRQMIDAPTPNPGSAGEAMQTNLKKIDDDAIDNPYPDEGRRFSKEPQNDVETEVQRYRRNSITTDELYDQAGIERVDGAADVGATTNVANRPEPRLKDREGDVEGTKGRADDADVNSADDLEKKDDYPRNEQDIKDELDTNKSVENINQSVVKRLTGSSGITILGKVAKYTIIGSVVYGTYVGLIAPMLKATGGCFLNNFTNSSAQVGDQIQAFKIVANSCVYPDKSNSSFTMEHPFITQQQAFYTTNSMALIEGFIPEDGDGNTSKSLAYGNCTDKDINAHGPCGGYCSFTNNSVLEYTGASPDDLEKGQSLSCDSPMGLIEGVVDLAIGTGTNVIEDVVDGVIDIGSSVFNNIIGRLMNNPLFLIGVPIAVGLLIIIFGKNTKVGIWAIIIGIALMFLISALFFQPDQPAAYSSLFEAKRTLFVKRVTTAAEEEKEMEGEYEDYTPVLASAPEAPTPGPVSISIKIGGVLLFAQDSEQNAKLVDTFNNYKTLNGKEKLDFVNTYLQTNYSKYQSVCTDPSCSALSDDPASALSGAEQPFGTGERPMGGDNLITNFNLFQMPNNSMSNTLGMNAEGYWDQQDDTLPTLGSIRDKLKRRLFKTFIPRAKDAFGVV